MHLWGIELDTTFLLIFRDKYPYPFGKTIIRRDSRFDGLEEIPEQKTP